MSCRVSMYKSRHKIRRAEKFSSCTKNGVFFIAGSREKDTIFVEARNIFGPCYIVTALGNDAKGCMR